MANQCVLRFTANVHVGLIGMEACGGAHFLGRALREQRHEVRLIPAQYVKPYVKMNKSDYIDAEAIAEAVARPTMRFVPIKSDDQLDMQSLHRVRERWVMRRTAVINQIRSLLLERGITLDADYVLHRAGCSQEDDQLLREGREWPRIFRDCGHNCGEIKSGRSARFLLDRNPKTSNGFIRVCLLPANRRSQIRR